MGEENLQVSNFKLTLDHLNALDLVFMITLRPVEEFNARATNGEGFAAELEAIQLKLRGQGHPKRIFQAGERITVEVEAVRSAVTVQWQSGQG